MNLFVNKTLIFVFILIAIDLCFCKGINQLILTIILKFFKRFIVIIEVPVLLPLPSQSAVTEKSFFRLFCQISTGNRPLFFQWLKNGQTLANSPENEYKIENNDDFSIFTIKSVDRSDSGNYSCVVRNEFGTDVQSAVLTVKGLIQLFCYKIWFNF
jgi:hypothetical protein